MTVARLIKLMPTGILVGFVAYACVSLQGALPDGASAQAELTKGLDVLVQDIASDSAGALKQAQLRDPFLPVVQAVEASAASGPEVIVQPQADPLEGIVAGLSLNATIIQGRDQFAIINGRIYNKGQRLVLPGDGGSRPPLVVQFVKRTGVILRGGGKNYTLGYPDQLARKPDVSKEPPGDSADAALLDPAGQAALFQKLLNSPLGNLGKGLIGNLGAPNAQGSSRSTRRSSPNLGGRP
jgi:hypothetical protein